MQRGAYRGRAVDGAALHLPMRTNKTERGRWRRIYAGFVIRASIAVTVASTPVRIACSGSTLKIALWWLGTGVPPGAAASSTALLVRPTVK
jgi:hypothetical protein